MKEVIRKGREASDRLYDKALSEAIDRAIFGAYKAILQFRPTFERDDVYRVRGSGSHKCKNPAYCPA